jgi:uncharacterized membrane protein
MAVVVAAMHRRAQLFFFICAPMLLAAPLASFSIAAPGLQFVSVYPFVVGVAWAAARAIHVVHADCDRSIPDWLCLVVITVAIAALTAIHVAMQRNFYDHFMLGHADIGHYLEEMKNVLAGRGLRSDSFPNTRLGWHFTPLLYCLVPGYALWLSPTYLMVLGPLFLCLTAFPLYRLARTESGSAGAGLLLAIGWLLVPSLHRLIYCNTYGFQWLYFSIPFIALSIACFHRSQWTFYWAATLIVLLTQETNAAIVFGFGLYSIIFTRHRWIGCVTASLAIIYLLLCTDVLIPYFAAAQRYERMDLFGDLGASPLGLLTSVFRSPDMVWHRLSRPEPVHLIVLLLSVTGLAPLLHWRLLTAAAPMLLFISLLQNADWLSIKFWHHAGVLPVFFSAVAIGAVSRSGGARTLAMQLLGARSPAAAAVGIAAAVLVAAAWGHYFFGFSPISKPYAVYAAEDQLHQPDPRLALVERLRRETPQWFTVLATERIAAHFTDYKRLFTGGRPFPADLIIIDRLDSWDTSPLPQRATDFAADPDYELYVEAGPVVVFRRISEPAHLPP